MIHMIRLPVLEPERMKAALTHLESMIALSRESWKFILAETDDDHEWVPNPKQHTVMPGGAVTDAMVKGWMEFLDEAQAILKGEKLIPFWRRRDDRGVNLRRVFTEPTMFDLVLWIQGTGRRTLSGKGPEDQAGDLATPPDDLPGPVHRLRLLVQLIQVPAMVRDRGEEAMRKCPGRRRCRTGASPFAFFRSPRLPRILRRARIPSRSRHGRLLRHGAFLASCSLVTSS